uniref:Uncharacterized protein n=1 Tax=Brugia pahangi TaxID=6280 RepID=A0A0N4SWV9_BRUPA
MPLTATQRQNHIKGNRNKDFPTTAMGHTAARHNCTTLTSRRFENCAIRKLCYRLSVVGVQGEFTTTPWDCGRTRPFPFLLYSQSLWLLQCIIIH